MGVYIFDSGQYIFERALQGLWIVGKWIFKAIVYLPLWFAGYIITANILSKDDSAFAWIALVLLVAFFIYQLVFFLKGLMIGLRNNGNLIWLLLFILCVAFTSVFPTWMMFENVKVIMSELSKDNATLMTWIFSVVLGLYILSQYNFLTDMAPGVASTAYEAGLGISS
ncbi:MAG TPA: hypothetical protein VJU78_07215 [Chitinophagaceae bacterium]|nr:hypothetical protein [Chitinophagaceae bacterium]